MKVKSVLARRDVRLVVCVAFLVALVAAATFGYAWLFWLACLLVLVLPLAVLA